MNEDPTATPPTPGAGESYRRLAPAEIIRTARQLERRVSERFPDSGLSRVCGEIVRAAGEADAVADSLAKPNYPIRTAVGLCIALLVAAILGLAAGLRKNLQPNFESISDLLQGLEAGVNDLVFIGFAIWFLSRLEARWKRRRALRSLHGLRSLAHIVDMHQLTKDPTQLLKEYTSTASSDVHHMSELELLRYLDYCSEMLSLTGKLAALYMQDMRDPVIIETVTEIEDLTTSLSRKIWQKIMILQQSSRDEAHHAASVHGR